MAEMIPAPVVVAKNIRSTVWLKKINRYYLLITIILRYNMIYGEYEDRRVEKMPESEILDRILNRIDQLDDKFSDKFNHLDHRIDRLDERFNEVDDRLDKVDDRLDKVDDRFDKVDDRFDKVDDRFDKVDDRFNKVDDRFNKVDDRFDMIYDQTIRLTLGQTALKMDINEIKSVYNYLNNEVARNSKDIYVMKNEKN
jgi:chromosome segregation ATPase